MLHVPIYELRLLADAVVTFTVWTYVSLVDRVVFSCGLDWTGLSGVLSENACQECLRY